MLRALVWKEWREQRLVFTMGLAIAAGMPLVLGLATVIVTGGTIGELSGSAAPDLAATLIWPLLAALFGAGAIGSERVERTLDFLVSRPASRARLWVVKVATAVGCLLLVMTISATVLDVFTREPFFVVFLSYWQWAALSALLVFASSVLVSHRASRPLAAAAIGVVVALATFLVVPTAIDATIGSLRLYRSLLIGEPVTRSIGAFSLAPEKLVGMEMAACSSLYLLVSLWVFARRELRRGIGLGAGAFAGVGIVAVCFAATTPAALAQWALSPSWGYIDDRAVSPDGAHIVFTVKHQSLSQVWVMPTDGGEMRRLSHRSPAAMSPVFSPDGEWVAYFTERYGTVGLRYRDPDLWLARADGSSARRLVTDLPRSGPTGPNLEAIFTADGGHIAVLRAMHLCLVATSDGRMQCADMQGHFQAEFSPRLIGSSSSGAELFLAIRSGGDVERVLAVAAETGAVRTIASFRRRSRSIWLGSVRAGSDDYLIALQSDDGPIVRTLNTRTGTLRNIRVCYGMGVADALYYAPCEGPQAGFLVRHDVATGNETRIAEVDAVPLLGNIVIDSTGERVAFTTEIRDQLGRVRVFGRQGEIGSQYVAAGDPTLLGWTPSGQLIVGHGIRTVYPRRISSWGPTSWVSVVDPETGESYPLDWWRR